MKRKFFRKPIIKNISNRFYEDMIKGIEKYQKDKKCVLADKCKDCDFSLGAFCLLNVLKSEFGKTEKKGRKK